MKYDVVIIGAGPGGIFSAYELMKLKPELKVVVLEAGQPLEKRKCPIDGKKIKNCIHCKSCGIMNGFGGAGAFSDGKYNITNQFGGTLHEYIGKREAIDLMKYVDDINMSHGGEARSFILQPIQRLRRHVCRTICICWMHPYVTWEQTLITWSLRTFIMN